MLPKFYIYKSSAGSGKTTALIKIFLTLSLSTENPSQFKKILAITFTNKAAAEMKERLIHELHTMSQLDVNYSGDNFMVNELLKETSTTIEKLSQRAAAMFKVVLHDFNDLSIGTIDQFNHRLIRSFSRELHLKSDFEVELQEKELFREAVNRLIEKVGRDEFITGHLMHYVQYKLDEERKANIEKDLMDLFSLVLSETGMEALEALGKLSHDDFASIRKKLLLQKQQAQELIQKNGTDALELIDSVGLTPHNFSGKSKSIGSFFERIAVFPHQKINSKVGYVSKALEGTWVSKTAPGYIKAAVESIEEKLHAILVKTLDTYENQAPEYYRAEAIFKHIDLIAILEELSTCMDEICDERNILPISKFNKIISNALRKEPVSFLYEHYGTRFNHILIDEYQDTSELQWFNILPLIDESLSKGHSSLVVGDAKQSIYRWRGGKAEQLIALPKLIDPPVDLKMGIADTLVRNANIVELNTNYRSKPNIVNFNNTLFSQLGIDINAPESLYESEYKEENVSQKLKDSKDEKGYVRIDCFGKKPDSAVRCDQLIENIHTFKEKGYAYRDMAVLVRSTVKDGRMFLSAMQAADIPVSTANSFEVDKDVNVQLIIAFLRLTLDPQNPAAVITVMRSFESIFEIPYEPEKYLTKNHKNKSILSIDAFTAKNKLPALSTIKKSKGLYDSAEALISAYLPGIKNRFLNGLLDIIISRVGMNSSVFDFFDWWDNLNEKPSVSDRSGSDAVQLMTIHKSKGLQFKVVFVPHLNWKKRSVNNELAWFDLKKFSDSPIPYAPFPLNSRLDSTGLSTEWEEEENANNFDNLNLIYVALTRAVDALCIGYEIKTSGHVGSWMNSAMTQLIDSKLNTWSDFNFSEVSEEQFRIMIGNIPDYNSTTESEEISFGDIPWTEPATTPWTENIQLTPIFRNRDQLRGIWFHRIVAQAQTDEQIQKQLEKLEKSGELNKTEIGELSEMLKALYLDEKFLELREKGKIIAERDLFFEGEILRPDLVFENETNLIVIDFKTGIQKPEHSRQITRYAHALKSITAKPVIAYLLYTNEMKWEKVGKTENIQGSLF